MPELFVTPHAIERYRERVADVAPIEVCRRLNSAATDFGAPFVKLSGGQRVVIEDGHVVTVLPKHSGKGARSYQSDERRTQARCTKARRGDG